MLHQNQSQLPRCYLAHPFDQLIRLIETRSSKIAYNGTFTMTRRRTPTISVLYLLLLIAFNQFAYPFTEAGGPSVIIYQSGYAAMFLVSVFIPEVGRAHVMLAGLTAFVFFGFSVLYVLEPEETWRNAAVFLSLIPFQISVIVALFRLVFNRPRVTAEVIYAAVSIYLLLGAVFVPVFGALETFSPGSFVDTLTPDAPVVWQQLVYHSYVSLTTLGLGDILPASSWARSLVSLEAVVGVLYLAILMARLVGLYGQSWLPDSDDDES